MGRPQLLPAGVLDYADRYSVPQLNALLAEQRRGGGAAGVRAAGVAPFDPAAVLGQLADDLRFLRRLVAFGRARIIAFLAPATGPTHHQVQRAAVECSVDQAPVLSCRLTVRLLLNWAHVFRSLFPTKYTALHRALAEAARDRLPVVHQSRLVFRPPDT